MSDWCVQTGKVRYVNRGDARQAMREQRQRGDYRRRHHGTAELGVYLCRVCNGWHIGHEPIRVKLQKRGIQR